MAKHQQKNKNDRWRGLLVLLLLLLFVAKDKIMELFSPCSCEDVPAGSNGFPSHPPAPDYPVFGSAESETLKVDVEEFERAEDSDVMAFTGENLFKYAYDPNQDMLSVTRETL